MTSEEVSVLRLSLHGTVVGHLVGFHNGNNTIIFDENFRHDPSRPTFTMATSSLIQGSTAAMSVPWSRRQKLHPVLSNLLPEGSLRELIAQNLKIHPDSEFHVLAYLGKDLPGALIAEPVDPEDVPRNILGAFPTGRPVKLAGVASENKFSLAGVQMKFSMKEIDGRYNLSKGDELGDWIVKPPSTRHKDVPVNEYTAMRLAEMIGVDIPQIKLVEIDRLENLPPINLPNETLAFAIKRFDRDGADRIHMEDFAQVFRKYPHEKYGTANYEQIGRMIYTHSGSGLADIQQLARRLLANILLSNGGAHLKNWSIIYHDRVTPRLSLAYDILTTSVYINDERNFALNLGNNKDWYAASIEHFKKWSENAGTPWKAIKPHIDDAMDKARTLWLAALNDLPMNEKHKTKLRAHWQRLQDDFKI